tara:strand:- start:3582 stop:3779 length:198 start_codon:yes stop_codon:yes gene_type:complete
MRLPVSKIVDVDEYKIVIEYDGKGGLDVTVIDELGEEIEGIFISDCLDCDENDDNLSNDIDINLN